MVERSNQLQLREDSFQSDSEEDQNTINSISESSQSCKNLSKVNIK